MGEALQELGSAARLDAGRAVDDQVLLEPRRVHRGPLDREDDPPVAANVAKLLLVASQVARDEFVAVETNPDAGHLRRAVGVESDEVGERRRLDQLARSVRQFHTIEPG